VGGGGEEGTEYLNVFFLEDYHDSKGKTHVTEIPNSSATYVRLFSHDNQKLYL
jgi:hypothetical protein